MWKTFSKALIGGVASSAVLLGSAGEFYASDSNHNVSCNFQHFNRCEIDSELSQVHSREELQQKFLADQDKWTHNGLQQLPTKSDDVIRIMTWNVHMCRDITFTRDTCDEIIEVIEAVNADILCLQEIRADNHATYSKPTSTPLGKKNGELMKDSGATSHEMELWQQEKLFAALAAAGYPHFVARLNTCEGNNLLLGNAICSRIPFEHTATHVLPTLDEETDDTRSAIEGFFRIPRQGKLPGKEIPLHVVTTHLDVWDESGYTRTMQMEYLMDVMNKREKMSNSQLLMGDFNSVSWERCGQLSSEKMKFIELQDRARSVVCKHHPMDTLLSAFDEGKSKLVDVFVQNRPGISLATNVQSPTTGHTIAKPLKPLCSTVWSGRCIDYILLHKHLMRPSSPFHVLGVYCYPTKASDHVPLIIDLRRP